MAGILELGRNPGLVPDMRRLVLIATIKRAVDTSRAIRLLAQDVANYESIGALVRCLIEAVVNGAYLQAASDDELNAYLSFDLVPIAKLVRFIEEVAPTHMSQHVPQGTLDALQAQAVQYKKKTGLEFGWTKADVTTRCVKIDKTLNNTAFVLLGRAMFPVGHAFVHGNRRSLDRHLPMLQGVQYAQNGINEGLYMSVLSLVSLAGFVNMFFKLNWENRLEPIGDMLRLYTARLLKGAAKR